MKSGWWSIKFDDLEPDDLSDGTLEHIAELIKNGYTSGEIIEEDMEG